MTLLDVSTAMSTAASIGAGMASANHVHAGFWGYSIAFFLSLMLGIACGWALRAGVRRAAVAWGDHPKTLVKRICQCSFLCAVFLWPFLAGILGGWATSSTLKLLR